jgi:hypothetical protein
MNKKRFIVIDEPFTCKHCGYKNPPLETSCRNHCKKCLHSLHVDKETPGDRESRCGGLMEPIYLDYSGKKGFVIVHKCTKCNKEMRNKKADDDNEEAIRNLSSKPT